MKPEKEKLKDILLKFRHIEWSWAHNPEDTDERMNARLEKCINDIEQIIKNAGVEL